MTAEYLARFVRQHDPCQASTLPDGTLQVSSIVVYADGTVTSETEIIPATLGAVRDWLGY